MFSNVFNVLISAFSSNSLGSQGAGYPGSNGREDITTAISSSSSPAAGRRRLSGGQDSSVHDQPLKKTEDLLGIITVLLNQLLLLDEQLTGSIGFYAHPTTNLQHAIKWVCKILEISGHGVPWFTLSILLLLLSLFSDNRTFFDYGFNMFVILVVDILVVAPVKVIIRRPRPSMNIGEIPLSISKVDNYAFPSGHTSRCIALAAYFCYMPPFNPWTHLWYIWGMLVSMSRVAIGRHHVTDVMAGVIAGLFIFEIVRRAGVILGV